MLWCGIELENRQLQRSHGLGMTHSVSVLAAAQPLSVELGPGIMSNIFDGIQRPLKMIAIQSGDVFIPRGVAVPALDPAASWGFEPTGFKVKGQVTGALDSCWMWETGCESACSWTLQARVVC